MATGDKKLAIELVASALCVCARSLGQGQAPPASAFVADLMAFGVLSGVSMLIPPAAGLCESLGGLVVAGEFLSPGGPGAWFISLMNTGSLSGDPSTRTTSTGSGPTPQLDGALSPTEAVLASLDQPAPSTTTPHTSTASGTASPAAHAPSGEAEVGGAGAAELGQTFVPLSQ